jgi:hypothetical protein
MDPYYATGVCCCRRIIICRVTVNLHYSVLITNGYNLKFKYKNICSTMYRLKLNKELNSVAFVCTVVNFGCVCCRILKCNHNKTSAS